MLHHFRVLTARQCKDTSCTGFSKPLGPNPETGDIPSACPICAKALTPIWKVNHLAVSAAVAASLVLAVGLFFLVRQVAQHRRGVDARAEFVASLEGSTQEEIRPRVDRLQAKYHLTEAQRQKLLAVEEPRIKKLPHGWSPVLAAQFESRLRGFYDDGLISPAEQTTLDQLTQRYAIQEKVVQTLRTDLDHRIQGAQRELARGQALIASGRADEALARYETAIQLDPGNSMAWANLGAVQMRLGQASDALASTNKAIAIDGNNWLALYSLGLAMARGQRIDEAFQFLKKSLSCLPAGAPQLRREVLKGLLEEPDLSPLQQDPRFTQLLEEAGAVPLPGFERAQ